MIDVKRIYPGVSLKHKELDGNLLTVMHKSIGPMTTMWVLNHMKEHSPYEVMLSLKRLAGTGILERSGIGRGTRWYHANSASDAIVLQEMNNREASP